LFQKGIQIESPKKTSKTEFFIFLAINESARKSSFQILTTPQKIAGLRSDSELLDSIATGFTVDRELLFAAQVKGFVASSSLIFERSAKF